MIKSEKERKDLNRDGLSEIFEPLETKVSSSLRGEVFEASSVERPQFQWWTAGVLLLLLVLAWDSIRNKDKQIGASKVGLGNQTMQLKMKVWGEPIQPFLNDKSVK